MNALCLIGREHDAVRVLQRGLNCQGLGGGTPLQVDGDYGTNTKNAVIAWQNWANRTGADPRLVVDGKYGPKTGDYWFKLPRVDNGSCGPRRRLSNAVNNGADRP